VVLLHVGVGDQGSIGRAEASVGAGSVPQWSRAGISGHQWSLMIRRNSRLPALQLKQQGRCMRAIEGVRDAGCVRGGQGGTPPLRLEVRLDALGAVVLDGLSYRRAARMTGICKTEVGDSLDLLLGELAALGLCQPDGTFVATLQDLRERLAEMTEVGEAACVDGLATRVQRPGGRANQKVLYDAKRRTHTAQGVALSTIHGDLLWCDGGWPGSCHEHELLEVSGVRAALDATGVTALVDRGFRGTAKVRVRWHAPIGDRRSCGAGVACCTGSGTSTGPPRRSSASADGSTASRHEKASGHPH
jgi:hypothetical protein